MIGILGTAGRAVATQLAREAGREVAERALQRLIARGGGEEAIRRLLTREGLEEVVDRDLLKQLGRRGAQMLIGKIGQETYGDFEKNNKNWNDRMNDFTRNLNEHFRQHRTLYAEERNVANKEKIEDRRGLWNAYSTPSGFYKTGKTL